MGKTTSICALLKTLESWVESQNKKAIKVITKHREKWKK
jgi:hypothetical protein